MESTSAEKYTTQTKTIVEHVLHPLGEISGSPELHAKKSATVPAALRGTRVKGNSHQAASKLPSLLTEAYTLVSLQKMGLALIDHLCTFGLLASQIIAGMLTALQVFSHDAFMAGLPASLPSQAPARPMPPVMPVAREVFALTRCQGPRMDSTVSLLWASPGCA